MTPFDSGIKIVWWMPEPEWGLKWLKPGLMCRGDEAGEPGERRQTDGTNATLRWRVAKIYLYVRTIGMFGFPHIKDPNSRE
jgi:hypothetical protein